MKIAVYQTEGTPGDAAANLDALEHTAARAARQGARLVICPEMYLTGYNIGDSTWQLAQPVTGEAFERTACFARTHRIAVLLGYPEREGDAVYNAAMLVDASGRLAANYRKTHLYGSEEKRLFRPGESFATADIGGLALGILICYDIEFPEPARLLALGGVRLVAVPTALKPADEDGAAQLIPARARENQVFVAYANRCGNEHGVRFCGQSRITAPDGRDLARAASGEELLVTEVDPGAFADVRAANPYLGDRRPELYGELANGT
ncbi:MAG: carbon-nitrogen hydrolase family protein [Kiloniellales bacterium]